VSAAPQAPPQQQQQQPGLPAGMQDVFAAHNFYRARHQAPPVEWDESLAASAQGVAASCPNSPSGTQGVGENLAWGFKDGGAAVDECEWPCVSFATMLIVCSALQVCCWFHQPTMWGGHIRSNSITPF
jgi:hypothetical protein